MRFPFRLLVVSLLLLLASCAAEGPYEYAFEGNAMGTTYSVKLVAETPLESSETQKAAADVAAAIDGVNSKMSTYLNNSELSRFNQLQSDEPFVVSADTLTVLVEAQRIGLLSGGVYDITVGPLVNAWGFGPGERTADLTDEALTSLLASVGWDKIELDPAASTIRKLHPGVYVDLSSIAKGFGSDKAAEALEALGYARYMVELGGEVRASGFNSAGEPWRLAVEQPLENQRAIERVIPLENLAMATSGDYRNYYDAGGERISHTIDPRTGRPSRHHVAAVTVIDPSCMTADAWATAFTALGEEEGFTLAEQQGLAVLFQIRQEDGSFLQKPTAAFLERFGPSN